MDEDGFYVGQLESSGRRGLAPSNFLREISHPDTGVDDPRLINGGDPRRRPLSGSTTGQGRGSIRGNRAARGGSRGPRNHPNDDEELDMMPRQRGHPARMQGTNEVRLTLLHSRLKSSPSAYPFIQAFKNQGGIFEHG